MIESSNPEDASSGTSYAFLYGPTWDAPSQVSKHHLARYWASSGSRVLYTEAQFHPFSLFSRRSEVSRMWGRFIAGPQEVADGLWVQAYPSLIPYRSSVPLAGSGLALWINQSVPAALIKKTTAQLGIQRPIAIVATATALPLLSRLDPQLVIYHCSDDYSSQPNFPVAFEELENRLIQRSDLVICTAETLRLIKAPLHEHVYTVTNGADIEHFMSTQAPSTNIAADISSLPRPVVGYIGTIFEWVDILAVARAARARPDYSFVFIGPVSTDVSQIENLPNVHLLGPRPYSDLPSYLKGFDVATVPFVIHDVTLRASPVKFYEYLASGIPIVAAMLPDLERFQGLAELYNSHEDFIAALDRSVRDKSPKTREARLREATKNSWQTRFSEVDRLIAEALQRKLEESSV